MCKCGGSIPCIYASVEGAYHAYVLALWWESQSQEIQMTGWSSTVLVHYKWEQFHLFHGRYQHIGLRSILNKN